MYETTLNYLSISPTLSYHSYIILSALLRIQFVSLTVIVQVTNLNKVSEISSVYLGDYYYGVIQS